MQTKATSDAFDAAMISKSLDKIERLIVSPQRQAPNSSTDAAKRAAEDGGSVDLGLEQPPPGNAMPT